MVLCWPGNKIIFMASQIAKFMGPIWGPRGSCRPQMGPKLAPRFVLRDQVSSYDILLEKAGYESFRIHAVKLLLVEMFKIFNGLSPEYLSDIFEKSDNPYCMRDKNKLIQPLKRTTTYGLRSFEYYGSHVWNMLPVHFKSFESISEFKNSIKRWSGPKFSCSMYVALLWFDVYRASSFMHMFYCLCEMTMLECCI